MNALERISEVLLDADKTDGDKLDAIQEIIDEEGY
jgi:hypothetical protein